MINNALQLISIQHELGMAIGQELLLKPMLNYFNKVCLRRLGLAGMSYYFYHDTAGSLKIGDTTGALELRHYLRIPDIQPQEHRFTQDLVSVLEEGDQAFYSSFDAANEEYLYSFPLGDVGLLVLHRRAAPLDIQLLKLLTPIFRRLALSCYASIEHEQLLSEIVARQRAEETVTFQLYHDELTLLPNRHMLMKRLAVAMQDALKNELVGAVLFIDLDRFKTINDTLGHSVGDELLKSVADTLRKLIGAQDFAARLSGDEFIVLIHNQVLTEIYVAIDYLLQQIRAAFSHSLQAGDHLLKITPSIGIQVFPFADATPHTIMRNADAAMYLAKSHGPNSATYYDHQLSHEIELRLETEQALQAALKNMDEFELYFQPQYSADENCIGAEALLRWNTPNKKISSPALFIPVAEKTGLMLELGKWVIQRACEHLHELQKLGIPATFKRLAVNVSAIQFNQTNFVADLRKVIDKLNVNPTYLELELTESSLVKNLTETVQKMKQIRAMGIAIAIDDFGTGYSSLAYLARFPISTLKIDQAFVRNIHCEKINNAIVEAIMGLGKNLDFTLIAEGVETEQELIYMKAKGCQFFQGYYFSRPQDFESFKSLIYASYL